MSRLDAKAKLEEAIQDYVQEVHGTDSIVRTDYILTVAAIDYHAPVNAAFYYHESAGPLHTRQGLLFMHQEEIKMLNREEAEAANNE